jgi:acetylornithine deacetylase/succinyl-diaminopimelate desuccinylase
MNDRVEVMSETPDRGRMITLLEHLVGFDTENPPGREVEAVGFLAEELKGAGFEVETMELLPGRANVIASLANGPGPTFAFNSHIDVVPAGDGWSSDPLRLAEKGGNLFGRGACDAKGPIVAMVEALRSLAAARATWSGTLLAVFVADEEAASLGAKAYVKGGPHIDYVIVGEPTSNEAVIAHKGSLRPLVRVHGRTAHSGTPDLGENAILKSAELLGLIARTHDTVSARTHPLVGAASLTVTRAFGGLADNVIPDACEFLLDRRMIPGEDEDAVKREIQDLLDVARERFGVRAEIIDFKPTTGGATETDPEHPVVHAVQEACALHHGHATPLCGFQGGCDLVHFRSIGAQGVVLGPGSLAVAHKPDEFVPIDEFVTASLIYRDTAFRMLRGQDALA